MDGNYATLNPSPRILMGPGPSDVPDRVLRAMAAPTIGHLDPEFLAIMDDVGDLLRYVLGTKNAMTIPLSATGSAGMEAVLVNLLEPGDTACICVNGVFGTRMADIVGRCGAELITVGAEWGTTIEPEQVEAAIAGKQPKLVAIVQAETSTGVLQPLKPIADVAHGAGALFVVDAVTSVGGHPVELDANGIDACYAGTQKALSCPPGLAPVSFNERAMRAVENRRTKVQSWYLDLTMIGRYWGEERVYHHTAPINMIYALREALLIVREEGLEARFARHRLNSTALQAGLGAMGIGMLPAEGSRLATLNAALIPDGVDDAAVRRILLADYGIEIGGGLGDLKGKLWRIGLMGHSSRRKNVLLLLAALEDALGRVGHSVPQGAGCAAAVRAYAGNDG